MYDDVKLRKFTEADIENKVRWINDVENNKYLQYDLPLEVEKTRLWYEKNKENSSRYDAVVLYNDIPVGVIGLLNIDEKNKKADYYITIGERKFKGMGIGYKASNLLLEYAFNDLQLNKVCLYTRVTNIPAQKLYEKLGFRREGELLSDLIYNGEELDRYVYGMRKKDYLEKK